MHGVKYLLWSYGAFIWFMLKIYDLTQPWFKIRLFDFYKK